MAAPAWQSPFSRSGPISENVLYPSDDRLLAFPDFHLDHVETPWNVPGAQSPQPLVRTARDEGLFLPVHCGKTPHHRVLFPGLHLGKKQLFAFPCHDVHLTAFPAFEISRKDLAAACAQPVGGDLLPVVPRPLPQAARPRLRVVGGVEIPAETTDDDGDKAHVS